MVIDVRLDVRMTVPDLRHFPNLMQVFTDDDCGRIETWRSGATWHSLYMSHSRLNVIHLLGDTEQEVYCAMAEKLMVMASQQDNMSFHELP